MRQLLQTSGTPLNRPRGAAELRVSGLTAVASGATGIVLVLLTLREIFHELFHPAGSGSGGPALRRTAWRAFRRIGMHNRWALRLAGPFLLVATVATWTALLVVGWALVFWPYLPEAFRFSSPLVAGQHGSLLDAIYLSFVTLATLGYGDITPVGGVPRLLAPLEAAVGFALLTAGISWVLSVYPVLSRRRALSQRLATLHQLQHGGQAVLDLEPDIAHRVLSDLAAALTQVHADLVQSSISYYFVEDEEGLALPVWLPFAARLAADGAMMERTPAIRHGASMLGGAVEGYAAVVRRSYLKAPPQSTDDTLVGYAADHLRQPAA